VFPPDISAPTFIWRDPAASAQAWQIDVTFANGAAPDACDRKGRSG
jgi:hypothetical protein